MSLEAAGHRTREMDWLNANRVTYADQWVVVEGDIRSGSVRVGLR